MSGAGIRPRSGVSTHDPMETSDPVGGRPLTSLILSRISHPSCVGCPVSAFNSRPLTGAYPLWGGGFGQLICLSWGVECGQELCQVRGDRYLPSCASVCSPQSPFTSS